MRAYWAIMLVVVAVVVGYKLADQHRKDCINEGRAGCTILPWSGHVPGSVGGNRSAGSSGGGSAGAAGGTVRGIGQGVHNVGAGTAGTLGQGSKIP